MRMIRSEEIVDYLMSGTVLVCTFLGGFIVAMLLALSTFLNPADFAFAKHGGIECAAKIDGVTGDGYTCGQVWRWTTGSK